MERLCTELIQHMEGIRIALAEEIHKLGERVTRVETRLDALVPPRDVEE